MFDELFLMSFRSSNGSGMGAAGATSGMLRKVARNLPTVAAGSGGPCVVPVDRELGRGNSAHGSAGGKVGAERGPR